MSVNLTDLRRFAVSRSLFPPTSVTHALDRFGFVQADPIRARGAAHPREVHAAFAHGTVTNYWGGSSNATTHLLELMHYRGLLRVAKRDMGIRVYAAQDPMLPAADKGERARRLDTIVDVAVRKYAPLPGASLSSLIARLRYGVPQWRRDLAAALRRAKRRLAHATVDGVEWYWPADDTLAASTEADSARLLAPFDPIVWDRRRFELLWGWSYRFEAYTPAKRRKLGYYALPLLWRDRIVGWGNLSVAAGKLQAHFGYTGGAPPADSAF